MVEVLFGTSAVVLSLYFAVLAAIVSLKEQREFVPASTRGLATLSLGALTFVCLASLGASVYQEFSPDYDLRWVAVGLSVIFAIGVGLILLSLRGVVKRL